LRPGSESSHYDRHGLSRRAFAGGAAAAAAGPSLGSGLLWPVARGFSFKSDPSGTTSVFGQLGRVRNGIFLPLKMVMQSSLHAARSTAVKG